MTRLDTAARCCAYSPDGMTIAVGLGAPEESGVTRSKKDGALIVLNEEDLTVIFETRDTKKWIRECEIFHINLLLFDLYHTVEYIDSSDQSYIYQLFFFFILIHGLFFFFLSFLYKPGAVRFSPDNNVLALASGDSSIYLYNVEDFTSIGRCRGCSGPVTRFDFSSDSQWLHCNSNEYGTFLNYCFGHHQIFLFFYCSIFHILTCSWCTLFFFSFFSLFFSLFFTKTHMFLQN